MMKAILIDALARAVREVEWDGSTEAMRKQIGGWIELAYLWPNRDAMYVDEEGLLKPSEHFFRFALRGDDQPLAGNALIVGRELFDRKGNFTGQADVAITVAEVERLVRFYDRAQVDAWGKANASEPSHTIRFVGRDGRVHREVVERWGSLIGDMPKPED